MSGRVRLLTELAGCFVLMVCLISANSNDARLLVPTGDIICNHEFHVTEMEVECESCHPDITSSTKASDKNLPTMENCGDCHDVEDDENCGMCHRDTDEPLELANPPRPINFNHKVHLDNKVNCTLCHGAVAATEKLTEKNMPKMAVCMNCHDGNRASSECALCHGTRLTLKDLHPGDWRHQHGEIATFKRDYCVSCHKKESYCVDCHSGDNLTRMTHDLNYRYTHGLDARAKENRCLTCHDARSFCNDCHLRERRMPLEHSTANWRDRHGLAAISDVENCSICHDTPDPTCARSGCHTDRDGVRGTDPAIHKADIGRFDMHGGWHDNDNYFCYQCHTPTNEPGTGFCGYCHD